MKKFALVLIAMFAMSAIAFADDTAPAHDAGAPAHDAAPAHEGSEHDAKTETKKETTTKMKKAKKGGHKAEKHDTTKSEHMEHDAPAKTE